MSAYKKVKRELESFKDIKINKKNNKIIISKKGKVILNNYDMRFINYGNNAIGFIEYWKEKLKGN